MARLVMLGRDLRLAQIYLPISTGKASFALQSGILSNTNALRAVAPNETTARRASYILSILSRERAKFKCRTTFRRDCFTPKIPESALYRLRECPTSSGNIRVIGRPLPISYCYLHMECDVLITLKRDEIWSAKLFMW